MVRAIVGGRSQDDVEGYTLNRAFQSFRQPGSAIKPFDCLYAGIGRGYTPDTIVVDEPIENGPVNGDGTYSGAMTLRQAVALSKNTIAWKIFEEITPEVGISYLESMQFSNLDANDKRLPASVGGFTNGVSALEMAKGYATIKNDGGYRNPTCIIKITDADGQVLYQADQTASVVYKENACRQMTDMLQRSSLPAPDGAIHSAICHAPVRRERPTITRMAGSSATRHTIRPVFGWAMTSQKKCRDWAAAPIRARSGTPLCPGCMRDWSRSTLCIRWIRP